MIVIIEGLVQIANADLLSKLRELSQRCVLVDPAGPAGVYVPYLREAGFNVGLLPKAIKARLPE